MVRVNIHTHPRAAIINDEEANAEESPEAAFPSPAESGSTEEQAQEQRARLEAEITDRVVDLTDVVRDVYEYHGVSELGAFICYFVLGTLVLFMHWDVRYPIMKSNVQQTFLSFGDPPVGSGQDLSSVSCMYDGATYILAYANNAVSTSESRQLPNGQVQVDEYNIITYMRISVALQANCNYDALMCYTRDAPTASSGYLTFNTTGHWVAIDGVPGVGLGQMMIADIVSSSIGSRAASLAILSDLSAEMSYVAKYGYFISVDMVVVNQLQSIQSAYLSLRVLPSVWVRIDGETLALVMKRNLAVVDGPDQTVSTVSISSSLSAGLYVTAEDKARIAFEILFLLMNLYYLLREANTAWLAYHQFGGRDGIWRYFHATWTHINLIGFMATGAWCWWYFSLMISDVHRDKSMPSNWASVNDALSFGISLDVWMMAGIVSNLVLGVRMLKYMNLHASLRIYAKVLSKTWRTLRDFLFFFVYLLLLMGAATLAFFQISGGNPNFLTVQDALQSMTLLTFGFLDYETFRNDGLGLGTWQPTVIIVFWIVVMILIVISQNIVLSIVVYAYEEAKRTEPYIEASILSLLMHRIVFDCRLLGARLRMLTIDDFVAECVNAFHHELYLHGIGQESQGLFPSYLYARWSICQLPEVILLRNFFYDNGAQKFVKQSRWDAAFRHFKPVKNAHLLRSFGHMLNKVQGSEEALNAVVASAAPLDPTNRTLFAADVQTGPVKVHGSVTLTSAIKSIATGTAIGVGAANERSEPGAGGAASARNGASSAGAGSLFGFANSSRVTPSPSSEAAAMRAAASEEGMDGVKGGDSGGSSSLSRRQSAPTVTDPHSHMPDGRKMAASCEEPLDVAMLLHLMTVVIPNNEGFVNARHLLGMKLNRFSPECLPYAADYIMRVYAFPRSAVKHKHPAEHAEPENHSLAGVSPSPPAGPLAAQAGMKGSSGGRLLSQQVVRSSAALAGEPAQPARVSNGHGPPATSTAVATAESTADAELAMELADADAAADGVTPEGRVIRGKSATAKAKGKGKKQRRESVKGPLSDDEQAE